MEKLGGGALHANVITKGYLPLPRVGMLSGIRAEE